MYSSRSNATFSHWLEHDATEGEPRGGRLLRGQGEDGAAWLEATSSRPSDRLVRFYQRKLTG